MSRRIRIEVEEHEEPDLRKLARALIELARLTLTEEQNGDTADGSALPVDDDDVVGDGEVAA